MNPRGRRPAGSPNARETILAAARTAFAHDGYRTSLHGIAHDAGADPALVYHYLPDRATLFAKAVIKSTAGVNASLMHRTASIIELEPGHLGEGIVRAFIDLWDDAGADRFIAVIRAALGQGSGVEPFYDFIVTGILSPIVTHFCPDRPQLRAQLIASQIVGLGLARWVAHMDHIAGLDVETLAALVDPTIQCYTFDNLPDLADPA